MAKKITKSSSSKGTKQKGSKSKGAAKSRKPLTETYKGGVKRKGSGGTSSGGPRKKAKK